MSVARGVPHSGVYLAALGKVNSPVAQGGDTMTRETGFWLITITALALGCFCIFASFHWGFQGQELVRSFGEALFIAGFIAITVDRYMKWKMLHEVSEDVSKFLI